MRGADQAVAVPALPLRPFVSHYAGSCMRDVPTSQQLASRVVHLADLSDTMCNELMERLSDAHAWPQRFGAVDRPFTSSHATSVSAVATSASVSSPNSASRPRRPLGFFDSSMPAACSGTRPAALSTSRSPVASTIKPTWCTSGIRWPAARRRNGSSASSRFYKIMNSLEVMIDACRSSLASV